MLRIGLTGGMGAGKSTAARRLAERGAVLIDSDVIAREVVAPGTAGLAALVEAFGSDILAADGSLDRPALAAKAFADDESRRTLNGITHPLVGQRTMELIAAAPADSIVVQDVPLLVENGIGAMMNLVVVVMAETETRVHRLEEFRGITRADALARIKTQATDEQRRAAADVLLDNNGDPEALESQVDALWEHRLAPFEHNLRTRTPAPRGEVHLVGSDPTWDSQAQRLIARLALACGAGARRIDHIGSTAVPGLPAKDVLDIQVTVADLAAADEMREGLESAGFPRAEYLTDDPKPGTDPALWGKRVHTNADPGRPANVHVRVEGWPNQVWALAFRDWLRANAEAREEYLAVKRKAEAAATGLSGPAAIDAYLDVKTPWFDEVYARVLEGGEATSS
ncbi:dephospho-CoA kinase [Nocardia transvalensis]|uniref:Dephospho-CoA kinase n=1 Tax=Nocardia transvalensis TaxID=37333 RepID=A0A7W9PKN1_9NOCA|nr:dephospho-CoA kinase [Nocardia transvalensis]MBB5917781.1 dephospho-CoA kinase [Nocardia transvalensis]